MKTNNEFTANRAPARSSFWPLCRSVHMWWQNACVRACIWLRFILVLCICLWWIHSMCNLLWFCSFLLRFFLASLASLFSFGSLFCLFWHFFVVCFSFFVVVVGYFFFFSFPIVCLLSFMYVALRLAALMWTSALSTVEKACNSHKYSEYI